MDPRNLVRLIAAVGVACFTLAASFPPDAYSQNPSSKAPPKKTGFSGDPARKRGLELGFDFGLKAGKGDKSLNKKPNPGEHEAFKNPDKYYRYEFGSRASFVGGFKSGFVGGYQQAFGKKVQLKADGSTTLSAPTTPKPKATPAASPPSNPASDAL